MATATGLNLRHRSSFLTPNSNFSHFADDLSANERAILQRVRAFIETKVQPRRCST